MNYKALENLIENNKLGKGAICDKVGFTTQGFNSAVKNNTLKIKDLESFAKILNVPITFFFEDVSGNVINGNGNKNNKQSIINNQCTEIESLKKQIKLLEEKVKDKVEIIKTKGDVIEGLKEQLNLIKNHISK